MITTRLLERDEIQRIWEIDRREMVENTYCLRGGALVLTPVNDEIPGWLPADIQKYEPLLYDCHERGGWFCAAFDDETIAGIVVLDPRRMGSSGEMVQFKYLYIDAGYRGMGLGRRLFDLARQQARQWSASRLYISADPSQHTVDFYTRLGAYLAPQPDPALFALEPEDIHLWCDV